MRELKGLAEGILNDFAACPRRSDCLAPRFVGQRLVRCIAENDRGGIWHWATHAVGAIQSCDRDCPAEAPMSRLVEAMHAKLR